MDVYPRRPLLARESQMWLKDLKLITTKLIAINSSYMKLVIHYTVHIIYHP
jgi:hypothetical protein